MPAPGGLFATGDWTDTDYGPVPADAGTWAGCRLDGARAFGWSLLVEATIEAVERRESAPMVHHRGRYRTCELNRGRTAASTMRGSTAAHPAPPVSGVTEVTRRTQPAARRSRPPAPSDRFPAGRPFLRCAKHPDACEVVTPHDHRDTGDRAARRRPVRRRPALREFAGLRRTLRRFVFPMTVAFFLWYALYVLLSAYARDFMSIKVVGNINVALIFGLLQFVSTFLIAWLYARYADREARPARRPDPRRARRGG